MSTTRGRPEFHVGDRVKVQLGPRKLTGMISEDRGPIGVRGRRLFQVQVPTDPYEPMILEVAEDEIEAIPPGAEEPQGLTNKEMIDYLMNGGLISILQANLTGGRRQPVAWLCRDQFGNVTHTFYAERGMVGGQVVPSRALHDNRVFTPRKDAVLGFLRSFGLSLPEAEQVIAEVGTSP